MDVKYYSFTSSLVKGILLLILAFVLFIGKSQVYLASVHFVILVFFIQFILDIGRLFFRKLTKKKRHDLGVAMIFHLGTCIIFLVIPNLFYSLAPMLFSMYLLLIGLSQFVMCWVEVINGDFIKFRHVLVGIVCLIVVLPIFLNPVMELDRFIICVATYILLLGNYYLYDSIMLIIPVRTKNRLKRKIRITLPKIVEAIIPYSVMVEINRNLEVKGLKNYSTLKNSNERESDLNILIHTSNRGFNRMGHIDIYFENKVISYGNYDEGSRYFKEFFGDGVLFVANSKSDYINFCIDNSKKTVFDFGIILTNEQKKRVRKRIDELFDNTLAWNHKNDKKYNDGSSYAAKLYKKTKAKFYKFKKGKYRTYFILGTNCCYLADDILGCSGMDILSINGIITPGTYYDYLDRELRVKNSNVISKDVYNFDNRADKKE